MADVESDATTPWHLWRRFSATEVQDQMRTWSGRAVTSPKDELDDTSAWNRYYSEAIIAQESPGPVEPGGAFAKARALIASYEFSDPRIVRGHFDATAPLLGRTMLLEISAYGLHYLCGVRVAQVRDPAHGGAFDGERTVFAFRYDTLQGHIEQGCEWFVLTKHHRTGDIQFRIQATWRPGTFPNWWSRVGFSWVGPRFQRAWHRLAYLRLRKLLAARGLPPLARGRGLMHLGLPVDAPPVKVVGRASPEPDVREQEIEEVGG